MADKETKVLEIEKLAPIQDIIRQRIGDKFVVAYLSEDKCYSYASEDLTTMELLFIANTLEKQV